MSAALAGYCSYPGTEGNTLPASSVTDVQVRVLNSIFIIIADSDCTWLSFVAALDKKLRVDNMVLGKLLHKARETEPRAL